MNTVDYDSASQEQITLSTLQDILTTLSVIVPSDISSLQEKKTVISGLYIKKYFHKSNFYVNTRFMLRFFRVDHNALTKKMSK